MSDSRFLNLEELRKAIDMGLDIEFYLRNNRYNISWEDKPFIGVCPDGDAVFFEDADDLLLNYKVDGVSLNELWHEIVIIAM